MFKLKTGNQVAFQLGNAICPDFEQIAAQLGPDLAVAGEIVLLSDRGNEKDHFAVVHVDGIHAPLIVPVSMLKVANLTDQSDAQLRA